MSCGRRPAPRNVVKWDVGRPAPRPPRTFAVMRSPADCVVGGGVPDAPRRGQDPSLRCKGYGVVMARLRAGHARPLQTAVNGSRTKARPTECGKVGCRAACPQAAADVCGNEKPCGLCCRGRRPRRPAEGSRPLPTMQRIRGGNGEAAGRACPAPTDCRKRVAGERGEGGRQPGPFSRAEVAREWAATHSPSESPSPLTRPAPFDKGASTSPLRGFGGTPDSKVEEGPMALRTDSNTASV